jgi:hypothetical protein
MENIAGKRAARAFSVADWARDHAHVSRLMRELAQTSERGFQLVRDGNAIVERWQTALAALDGESTEMPIE